MRLDFVVPGFSKCGTTTLCSLLAEHPQIFIPHAKEPGYFAERHEKGWLWYDGFFRSATPGTLCGEGSTTYSSDKYAAVACDRILERFPETRFIFIARDPIRRLESSYREMHHSGYKYNLQAENDIGLTLAKLPNMLADTHYWKLLNVYRSRVPDDRILGIFLEDFSRDPERELQRCFEFLGVDHTLRIENVTRRLNSAAEKKRDSTWMRYLRLHPRALHYWNSIPQSRRERLERWLRLRKPAPRTVDWAPDVLQDVRRQLASEVSEYLKFFGKPADFWPCFSPADTPERAAA